MKAFGAVPGIVLGFVVALHLTAASAAPDHWPICPDPQPLVPLADVWGAEDAHIADLAWNGEDFGVLWSVGQTLAFQRVYADGSAASVPVPVAGGVSLHAHERPSIVWNGSGYGISYKGPDVSSSQAFFARLDPDGAVVAGPLRVSFHGTTAPVVSTWEVTLAFGGDHYIVLWDDDRAGGHNYDVYATILDAAGHVVVPDLPVCTAPGAAEYPSVSWSRAGRSFVAAWTDGRTGDHQVYTRKIWPDGSLGDEYLIAGGAGAQAQFPSIAEAGGALGLARTDDRDGNYEIYFTTLRPDTGGRLTGDVRLTTTPHQSTMPEVVWSGAEYGVFWMEDSFGSGLMDVWMHRVGASGSAAGSAFQVTYGRGPYSFAAAFATRGYMSLVPYPLQAQPIGCTTPTMPACPGGLNVYGVSGTTAILAWLPVVDPGTDIAYYQVFRDGGLVGVTSRTYFVDLGLTPGLTYQYNVRTVNAAQYTSGSCPESQIYVHASDAITLDVDRSGPDIDLTWNDAGQSTYRVMRGTSPQVMREIDRTAATGSVDEGAAEGSVCYFYSIDIP